MKRKNTYRTVPVQDVRLSEYLPMLMAGCIVALDVAKTKFVAALATWAGETLKLIRFDHPVDTRAFLALVEEIHRNVDASKVRVVMEPTSTYGDAIRYQLQARGVSVSLMPTKKTHDAAEVFDGVPSMHDPKASVVIARLAGQGLGTEWPVDCESRRKLRALVDRRRYEMDHRERCYGRIEAMLAKHWPEFQSSLDMRQQESAAVLLRAYPSPARVSVDEEGARGLLKKASCSQLSGTRIDEVVARAKSSLGVPMYEQEEELLKRLVSQVKDADAAMDGFDDEALAIAACNEAFARLAKFLGVYSAAVIVTHVDPMRATNAKQFEKACGLNLRHHSSGEHVGRLSITKRGPGLVRQVLYFAALRLIHKFPVARAWCSRRKEYGERSKMRANVALMRKLARAIFHVARGAEFDPTKLFDVRRLKLERPSEESLRSEGAARTAPPFAPSLRCEASTSP